jgi:hypothetical protein
MKYSWMVCLCECAAEGVFFVAGVDIWKDSRARVLMAQAAVSDK